MSESREGGILSHFGGMKGFTWIVTCLFLAACGSSSVPSSKVLEHNSTHLDTLRSWMTGDFSSANQSETDSNYYDITLHMHPVWNAGGNPFWLYVEQAATDTPESPYRQRMYRVEQLEDSIFRSDIFTLPNDSLVVGFSGEESYWNSLTPDSLTHKQDCEVYLTLQANGSFVGSTKGKGCSSSLFGSKYATSEVQIFSGRIQSWDRGYDSLDVYVWGAENGPYVFDRLP